MPSLSSKRCIQLALLFGTLISLAFVPWLLVKAWLLPLPDTIQAQLEQALEHGFDGIVVYVEQGGKPAELYAAGWHERENKIAARPDALFKIASINKLYVAVAITQLVHANRLSLDKTLADYFPELIGKIPNAEQITLKMLLQHRSGIANYSDSPNYWSSAVKPYQQTLELILGLPANFTPGTEYEYSNTNYLLLAKLIEKTTGQSKFAYIKQSILQPLNLRNTFGSLNQVNMDRLMGGYHLGVEENIKATDYGTILATAEDVGIFLRALNTGQLLSKEEQKIYRTVYQYNHGGWVPGYQSQANYYPDIDTVVIQFNNTTDAKLYYWNLSEIMMNRIKKIITQRPTQ